MKRVATLSPSDCWLMISTSMSGAASRHIRISFLTPSGPRESSALPGAWPMKFSSKSSSATSIRPSFQSSW